MSSYKNAARSARSSDLRSVAAGGLLKDRDRQILKRVLRRQVAPRELDEVIDRLLTAFEDLEGVLKADLRELVQVSGRNRRIAEEIHFIHLAAKELIRSKLTDKDVLRHWTDLHNYCRAQMGRLKVEEFRVLFLDTGNAIIADEVMFRGTIDHVNCYPRELCRRALELHASGLILIHNHPSGNVIPSEADKRVTRELLKAAQLFSITVHDHLIVSAAAIFSFRAEGYMNAFETSDFLKAS